MRFLPSFAACRRSLLLLATAAGLMASGAPAACAPDEPPPAPAAAGPAVLPDAHYTQVLKAYRGQLSEAQLEALDQQDPVPSLYLGPGTPGERELTRFFASLPDRAHAELLRAGYLKWPVRDLPAEAVRRLRGITRRLEQQGEGPFPLDVRSETLTGFIRVPVEGLAEPQYSWWIWHPKARRPAWITLVRAVGLLLQAHFEAHGQLLPEMLAQPDSAAVPAAEWLSLRELKPEPEKAITAPVLLDEAFYRRVLRAYRGELSGSALQAMREEDALVARRAGSRDPAERALNRFLARLPEKDHRALLTTGALTWTPDALTAEQRKLLEPTVVELNRRAREAGEAVDPYGLLPRSPVLVGLAIVPVPGAERPAVSWWIRSPVVPHPAWITLAGDAAARSPATFRAHLDAVGR